MKKEFKVLGRIKNETRERPKFVVLGKQLPQPKVEPVKRIKLVHAYKSMVIQMEIDEKVEVYQTRNKKLGPPIRIYPIRNR